MALRVSNGTGGGAWHLAASWAIAVPAGADTFSIVAGDTIEVQTAGGAVGCAGGTIQIGGTLQNNSTAGFTQTGAVSHLGTFGMAGSGSNVTPTLMTNNGCVWTCGVAAIWNVVGTLPYTAPDVRIVGNATSYLDFVQRPGITGTITKCEFRTFGHVNGVIYRPAIWRGNGMTISDLLFQSCTNRCIASSAQNQLFRFSGNILINQNTSVGNTKIACALDDGNTGGIVTIQNSVSIADQISSMVVMGTTKIIINENAGGGAIISVFLIENTELVVKNITSNVSINGCFFGGNSKITILANAGNGLFYLSTVGTLGLISIINGATNIINGISYVSKGFSLFNLTIDGTGTLFLSQLTQSLYWQASRSVNFVITGPPTSITHTVVGFSIQYEPILYKYDLVNYLFAIQYDMTVGCPNYTALYGASTLWTASTKTLAAGGVLRIYSTGHTATGMDMAISDLSGFTLATTGTAAYVATYQISFDGGVLWSAEITLAQLQSNSYIINGNTYTTDSRYDIQIRIILTSAGGGTVLQVRVTGIEYDPVQVSSWNVRNELQNEIEGTGFVTANDSLHQISTHKIGVPVALDGGLTTLAGNMTKIADDNNGADFDSTTDSLWAISNTLTAGIAAILAAIAAFAAATYALLHKILRIVQWIKDWIESKIVKYITKKKG